MTEQQQQQQKQQQIIYLFVYIRTCWLYSWMANCSTKHN